MNDFIIKKIIEQKPDLSSQDNEGLRIFGIDQHKWFFFLKDLFQEENSSCYKNHLIVLPNNELAENFYHKIQENTQFLSLKLPIFFLPESLTSLYSSIFETNEDLYARLGCIHSLSKETSSIIIASASSLLEIIPDFSHWHFPSLIINHEDIYPPLDLSQKLIEMGYQRQNICDTPGTFSTKGEVFDIYPSNHQRAYRLRFFDEIIENIFPIDPTNNKTFFDQNISQINVAISPYFYLSQKKSLLTLANKLPKFSHHQKKKYFLRSELLKTLNIGEPINNFAHFFLLFFNDSLSFLDLLDNKKTLIHLIDSTGIEKSISENLEQIRSSFQKNSQDDESTLILPSHEHYFIPEKKFHSFLKNFSHLKFYPLRTESNFNNLEHTLSIKTVGLKPYVNNYALKTNTQQDTSGHKGHFIEKLFELLKNEFNIIGKIFFSYSSLKVKEEIISLLQNSSLSPTLISKINFIPLVIEEGFYFPQTHLILVSDSDLFSYKQKKVQKPKKNIDLFAEQISTLKAGDYVVHAQYGVGRYIGMGPLLFNDNKTDFLTIEYQDGDKVYVPVYKINLLQKFSDGNNPSTIDNLKSKKFELAKSKARSSAKKLAFDYLKLQAERKIASAYSFSPPDHLFREFELSFPFEETDDQTRAIEDVLEDMQKNIPMDRLVCGDVGFGKTEVAIRAAYKAVLDQKQVAVLVPTTVLALQHFQTFSNRFKDFAINVALYSRLISGESSKNTLQDLQAGKIDIIIGTHRILSQKIAFKDLGLLIIDEEQRFGVGQKEKIKLMKAAVDCLTLTATPIPRTLQLSFLGLKDLSLIQSPPPNRQSIKSFLIKKDLPTIKVAIEKELARGGQVFFVHNRVQSIESIYFELKELLPSAKIVFAHGQLPPQELEKRMIDFYNKKYDILIATTIIESGIDIPSANTMIVNNAHLFGLSQLHQLRGRIGRSDRKAYAYFVVPEDLSITEIAQKRLEALQTYSEIGSGFSIASCDLELRGAGDLLGADQSGHIESIGLELYMELLNEAIAELKGDENYAQSHRQDIEIVSPFTTLIPENFIKEPSTRLKYYKKLSNLDSIEKIDQQIEEIGNIYGQIPEELKNLHLTLKTRITLRSLGINHLQIKQKEIQFRFDINYLEKKHFIRDALIKIFLARPDIYKLAPNFIVHCRLPDHLTLEQVFDFSDSLLKNVEKVNVG